MAPSVLREDNTLPAGRAIVFLNGGFGWISNGRATGALSGASLQQVRSDLFLLYPRLLLSDRIEGRQIAALDDQTIEIREGSAIAQLIFDPATGLPAKLLYERSNDRGVPVALEDNWSDFRDAGGLQLPYKLTSLQNGQKWAEGVVTDLKINQGLKLEELQRRP
jgi:hypothetical protein